MSRLITLLLGGILMMMYGYALEKPADADNFYVSDKVVKEEVSFPTLYNLKIAGNLFKPALMDGQRYPAIIVGHPMGAVKEQSANLYATKMAEYGFVTLAIDLPFWGASEGEPRNSVSPALYREASSPAADYLGTLSRVDAERIGVIGICGSGGFAISAAKIDPRLKAVATVSMYDMGAAVRDGLNKSVTMDARKAMLKHASEQRDIEFSGGEVEYTSGTVHELTDKSTPIEREFFEFYRTERGEVTPPGVSPETTTHPRMTSFVKFMNFYPFNDIEMISPRPLLFIAGENAHSIEFSEDAFRRAAEPKELYIVPGAGHVDLYDRTGLIPFDKLNEFFSKNL